jgi:hypothetical protein
MTCEIETLYAELHELHAARMRAFLENVRRGERSAVLAQTNALRASAAKPVTAKVTPRDEFDGLTTSAKAEVVRNGGRLTDSVKAAAKPSTGSTGKSLVINRAEFDALPPPAQGVFIRGGGRVRD